jgi:hypothetical protein
MPTFGAILRLSSQALFFEVTTEKTDKSQAVGEPIPPFKERIAAAQRARWAKVRAAKKG